MATFKEFPAFIKARYDPGSAFAELDRDLSNVSTRATQTFREASAQIRQLAQEGSRNVGQGLNFDFNAAGMREAANAAEIQAVKVRAAANALTELAREQNDVTLATRLQIQAWMAEADAAQQAASDKMRLAAQMEQVEARVRGGVGQTLQQQTMLSQANERQMRTARNASIQLGQQLQDSVVQIQAGTNAFTVFAQQGSQIAYIMAAAGNGAKGFATFMAGPWGAAIFAATVVLGGLVTKLWETESASQAAEAGSDGLSRAQSVLGEMFNLTSGALERQNQLLVINARLMAIRLRAEAATERTSSRQTLAEGQDFDTMGRIGQFFSRASPGSSPFSRISQQPLAREIIQQLEAGQIREEEALRRIAALPSTVFTGTGVSQEQIMQALVDRVSAPLKEETANMIDQSLASGVLAPGLRREGRERRERQRAAPSTESRDEFGRDAADRIQRLREQLDEVPAAIARSTNMMRQLDDLTEDLSRRQPPNWQALVEQAELLRPAIEALRTAPLRDLLEQQAESLALGELILAGHEDEAELLRERLRLEEQMGPLSDEQLATVRENIVAERELNEVIAERERQTERYLSQLDVARSAIIDIVADPRNIGDAFSNILGEFRQFSAESLVDNLLGGRFRQLQEQLRNRTPMELAQENSAAALNLAGQQIADLGIQTVDLTEAFARLAAASDSAAGAVGGDGTPVSPVAEMGKQLSDTAKAVANAAKQVGDEFGNGPIVARAQRPQTLDPVTRAWADPSLSGKELYNQIGAGLGEEIAGPLGRSIGENLGTFLQGAGYGQMAGGLLLGQSGNNLGAGIGGALGNAFGEKVLGPAIGSALGETLGSLGGPIGSIAGGIIGSKLFSAIMGTPKASATLSLGDYGLVSSVSGSKSLQGAASGLGGSVIDGLERIVEQLGGVLEGAINVSIGVRGDNYRVDPTGRGNTKESKGAIDFGEDQEAAVLYAIQDAIRDGIIVGLRQSTLNLIQGGGDLAGQLSKASRWEDAMDAVAQLADPVAFALKSVNEEFEALIKIGREAGATVEEMAGLEMLYNERRKKALEEAAEQLTGSLKDLLADLTVNNDARSLRSRIGLATADLMPYLTGIEAGETVDFDKFADYSRTFLDLQRQLGGSQDSYFDWLNRITEATQKALADQENIISMAQGGANPFGTGSTPVGQGGGGVVPAINQLGDRLLAGLGSHLQAVNDNLGRILARGSGGGGGASELRRLDRLDF